MKKPIAVKTVTKEEYELAIKALDKAGFKWYCHPEAEHMSMKYFDQYNSYICVDPTDFPLDYDKNACVYQEPSIAEKDYTILEFVDFFSTITRSSFLEFLDLYSTEAEEEIDVPEDTEERHNTHLEIVTMPDRISITNISQEMRELIKVHWEIDATVNTETFGFVAEIDTADFLDFCKEFIIADLDQDDLLFITACSLALLQVEDKYMSCIRVSI